MHDPIAWALPMGRLFGITVRLHWLFPFIALGCILRVAFYKPPGIPDYQAPEGIWLDASIFMLLLFVSVLLHELGHCFTARAVGGEASEILIWPLGGLAACELPARPDAHLLTAVAGPATNFLLCLFAAIALCFVGPQAIQPIWNPLPDAFPWRSHQGIVELTTWAGGTLELSPYSAPVWLARLFAINWFLGLLNLLIFGFPLDGGRILQAFLWSWMGERQATLTAVFVGFGFVLIVGLYAITKESVLAFALALFIYLACRQQWVLLETGSEDRPFGYDFSQGYTSLDREQVQAPAARPRLSWWKRWLQRRAARRIQRENERREAEERRLDALLDKLHREGRGSLTAEEERFMKRISDRYRDK